MLSRVPTPSYQKLHPVNTTRVSHNCTTLCSVCRACVYGVCRVPRVEFQTFISVGSPWFRAGEAIFAKSATAKICINILTNTRYQYDTMFGGVKAIQSIIAPHFFHV